MPILEILKYPDPMLKTVSEKITEIDGPLISFVNDLVETMKASPGVGLAAPQAGRPVRVIAIDVTPKNPGAGLIVLINPEIVSASGGKVAREGCLSVPEYTANIKRAADVVVKGVNIDGKELEISSTGLEAVALQHEIDHLDGILFIDRIANMKRDLFKRRT
ncbi:MAG: peptide deformylase [Deltaproteobacteria bacterium]|nr:peptide deformylase [Deltaproteobacteria bacterium]